MGFNSGFKGLMRIILRGNLGIQSTGINPLSKLPNKTEWYIIQGDQKVSVHLTITVHHQVHRDFLITLYVYF